VGNRLGRFATENEMRRTYGAVRSQFDARRRTEVPEDDFAAPLDAAERVGVER
jgi:hypothetical protein